MLALAYKFDGILHLAQERPLLSTCPIILIEVHDTAADGYEANESGLASKTWRIR